MNNIKQFTIFLIVLTLTSCGTSHNYSNNDLKKHFFDGKIIYFKLNNKSKKSINFSGMVVGLGGGIRQPNVKETFKLSIEELAIETNLRLKFIENSETTEGQSSNDIVIESDIAEINWHFGFSVATLKTLVKYKNTSNNQEISTNGIRKSGGGDEKNNLKKSLKDATYNFLKEFEKEQK
ncbi:hypothetical protein [Flavobacterium flavigenum]|uniref:hypothetical protein n=1 Tax=Flavobacterium flavigenum TaxID=3003258 RepID=UPI0022AC43CC|nr:hypothetical protein [Flavobacterium flavigenum]